MIRVPRLNFYVVEENRHYATNERIFPIYEARIHPGDKWELSIRGSDGRGVKYLFEKAEEVYVFANLAHKYYELKKRYLFESCPPDPLHEVLNDTSETTKIGIKILGPDTPFMEAIQHVGKPVFYADVLESFNKLEGLGFGELRDVFIAQSGTRYHCALSWNYIGVPIKPVELLEVAK